MYAHSANAEGQRHDLVAHLRGVAALAREFAEPLEAGEAAYYLGLWHDLGKFHPEFQRYLTESETGHARGRRGPDHKAPGTSLARQHLGFCALAAQGHHGGLRTPIDLDSWLSKKRTLPAFEEALALARQSIPQLEPASRPELPGFVRSDAAAAELFVRLVFSALVDADFLDTEAHFSADKAAVRGTPVSIPALWDRFQAFQEGSTAPPTAVNTQRAEILGHCLAAADLPPGLFRLAVPTGGGKTRSAMAFALRHALQHRQRRVVVAVPFITITQQTAQVYRAILHRDEDATPVVLEHHSALDPGEHDANDDYDPQALWSRLAAENWDSPVVVTTTLQLFESLFASGPSQCRKLHRLANSVIVLDEAQALPPALLEPMLDVLQQLCTSYGTTVVLSTATQPAFDAVRGFSNLRARDIVPDPNRYYAALKRVRYSWDTAPATWDEIAERLRKSQRALAVVNTKRDAHALLEALGDPDGLHLSTSLCGAHRARVVDEVRRRLAAGATCRLVSTQAIEAGVDVDFPLVLRAVGPLDSVIQAAGRCNREGMLERGSTVVFEPADGGLPPGAYTTATGITRALLGGGGIDPDNPAAVRRYFEQLYANVTTDRAKIQDLRRSLDYPEVARQFRMIDDDIDLAFITAYGAEEERGRVRRLLERLRPADGAANLRMTLRALQPYSVALRRRQVADLQRRGLLAMLRPDLPHAWEWLGRYDPRLGLLEEGPDPDQLMA